MTAPHLRLPRPWDDEQVALTAEQRHHLERVLRRLQGSTVTYTDGAGVLGRGVFDGGMVRRGEEQLVPRPEPRLTVAVAAPHRAERARFVVEKLAELGVDRLVWVEAVRSQRPPPRKEKAASWAASALEQSRGVFDLAIEGPLPLNVLPPGPWVAVPGAPPLPRTLDGDQVVVVGPEGGFEPAEIPDSAHPVGLGSRVLRTETAALAAAVAALVAMGRWST